MKTTILTIGVLLAFPIAASMAQKKAQAVERTCWKTIPIECACGPNGDTIDGKICAAAAVGFNNCILSSKPCAYPPYPICFSASTSGSCTGSDPGF